MDETVSGLFKWVSMECGQCTKAVSGNESYNPITGVYRFEFLCTEGVRGMVTPTGPRHAVGALPFPHCIHYRPDGGIEAGCAGDAADRGPGGSTETEGQF